MWAIKVACYRAFQAVFNIAAHMLRWRKAERVEGQNALAYIPELLRLNGAQKPLIVVSRRTAEKTCLLFDAAGYSYACYSGVEPNPSINTVEAIYALYRAQGCDAFVAIGGGSIMDAAKAAAARTARPEKSVRRLGGLLRVRRNIPLFIAAPTTAGSGSETTIAAIVTDTETHHKYAIMDIKLVPRYAVLDPVLTAGMPQNVTATTGMDALTHAIEAYLCWTYNTKESTAYAKEAVGIIFRNLEKAYRNGEDMEARMNMLHAAYLAGFAFTRAGVGNVHAISHTLSGLYNTPHGLANAIILPAVLEDYGGRVHRKLAVLAEAAGVAQAGAGDEENAHLFIEEIRAMNTRMGIAAGFDCIRDEDIPQMVRWAGEECNPLYPVPVLFSPERFRSVIERLRLHAPGYSITDECTGCGNCAALCPTSAITGEPGMPFTIDAARCVRCAVCGRSCPEDAIFDELGRRCMYMPREEWLKPEIDDARCTACRRCVEACAFGALALIRSGAEEHARTYAALQRPERCVGCGLCVHACPIDAVKLEGLIETKQ